MEQGGRADGLLQVRADRIQSDFEELMKALSERCKLYGLHVKSTAMVELPFGFAIAKELTIDLDNVGSTEKPKSLSAWSDKASTDEFSSNVTSQNEKPFSIAERVTETGSAYDLSEDKSTRNPSGSPGRSTLESPSQEYHSTQFGIHDISPRDHSDHGGAESNISGDKYFDEPSWTFDGNDDVDSVWGFNTTNTKCKQSSFFDSGDFGLNLINVDSPSAASTFGKGNKSSFFADSVPSTPLFNSGSSPKFNEGQGDHSFNGFSRFDSLSTQDGDFFNRRESLQRFDSIRSSTEFDHRHGESLSRFDSINSTRDFDRSRVFPSFDDTGPFGSTGPFKS